MSKTIKIVPGLGEFDFIEKNNSNYLSSQIEIKSIFNDTDPYYLKLTSGVNNSGLSNAEFSGNTAIGIITEDGKWGFGLSTIPVETVDINGRLHINDSTIPSITTNRLYAIDGRLYWNNTILDISNNIPGDDGNILFNSENTIGVSSDLNWNASYKILTVNGNFISSSNSLSTFGFNNNLCSGVYGGFDGSNITGSYLQLFGTNNGSFLTPGGGGEFVINSSNNYTKFNILNFNGTYNTILTLDSLGKVSFNNADLNEIININGAIYIVDIDIPNTFTNRLYSNSGLLYWNGSNILTNIPDLQQVTDISSFTTNGIIILSEDNETNLTQTEISTYNNINGTYAKLYSSGYLSIKTNEITNFILKGSNLTELITLEAPNKTTGIYTIATINDLTLNNVLNTDNTTGPIDLVLTDSSRISVANNRAGLGKGLFDTGRGGDYGVSLFCNVGFEFNWQAGYLRILNEYGDGNPIPLYLDSEIIYSSTVSTTPSSGLSLVTKDYVDTLNQWSFDSDNIQNKNIGNVTIGSNIESRFSVNSNGTLDWTSNFSYLNFSGDSRRFQIGDWTNEYYNTYIDINDDINSKTITYRGNNGHYFIGSGIYADNLTLQRNGAIITADVNNVYGTTSTPFTIKGSDGISGANGGGILILQGGNSFTGDPDLAGDVWIKGGINNYESGPLAGGFVRIFTNLTERITVSNNGYVGFNNNNPTEAIDVNGRILISDSTVPSVTNNKLYSVSSNLYWGDTALVTELSFSGLSVFNSDIVVSLTNGKTLGRYTNGDTIPTNGKTPQQVIELLSKEPIPPTLTLTSSTVILFNQTNISNVLNFYYIINSLGSAVSTVSLEWRRNNTGSWTVLSTNTSIVAYTHNMTDSNFNTQVFNYRYIVTDNLGGTTTVTLNITPTAYVAPTISFSAPATSITSPETNTTREKGNISSILQGSVSRNSPLVNILSYQYAYSLNGGAYVNIGSSVSSPSTSGGTFNNVTNNDNALIGANTITYKVTITDTYGSTTISTYTITFYNLVFYGSISSAPVTSAAVRGLTNKRFTNTGNTFNLSTGTSLINFSVAIPTSLSLSSVVDLDALNAIITSSYILNTFNVNNAGGVATSYKIYTMSIAVPYSTDHRHQITLI